MFKSIFSGGATILLLFISNLNATTYYVDNSGGNDGNSGTSISTAWNSISKVNSASFNSGDIISFKCGDRFTDATLTPHSDGLSFNNYGTGARPVIDGQSSTFCAKLDNRSNITFEGLKFVNGFSGSSTDPSANVNLWDCNHITFESCNIDSSKGGHITKVGLYDGQGTYLTIRNCTLSYGEQTLSDPNQGNLGIYLDGTDNALMEYDTLIGNFSNIRVAFGTVDKGMANGLIVRYCVLKGGRYDNIDEDGSSGAQFYYNVFDAPNINVYLFTDGSGNYDQYATRNSSYYNNTFITHGSEASIHLNSKTGVNNGMVFKNNIFYSDNSSGYFLYEEVSGQMGSWTMNNNIYYMTSPCSHMWVMYGTSYGTLAQWNSLGYDDNSINADPLFNNYASGDYSLQSGSKAIKSGINLGLTVDIKGNAVPSNNPDLGAFQHKTSSTTYIAPIAVPQDFSIGNYPNPFNPSTKIKYTIPAESTINLVIYNIIGEKIDELINDIQQPGTYELNWNASNHPSGIYLLSINISPLNGGPKNSKTIKMNLIK
jgi:hypothetical protein